MWLISDFDNTWKYFPEMSGFLKTKFLRTKIACHKTWRKNFWDYIEQSKIEVKLSLKSSYFYLAMTEIPQCVI